jgi:hypothetical protein
MGIQLTGEFLSNNGSDYDIYIYNESFVGSNYDVKVQGLEITWESMGDPLLTTLKASRCAFSFVNNNAAIDTFITNLVAGDEDQFKIVVKKQSDLFWCGNILADQVSWEDFGSGIRTLTVNAIDGIGRLQDIEFDYEATTQETLLKWIYEILEYNDLSQYWVSGAAYFKESCEIYDMQMNNTGTQYSPLLQTRCDRFLFLTDEVIGGKDYFRGTGGTTKITLPTYRPYTCAQILHEILQLNCAKIFMSEGSYYIQQNRNFASSSYNQRSISKALGVLSYQTVSPRKTEGTDWKRKTGGRWTYLPPLQEVRLDSMPRMNVAQSGGGIQQLDTGTSPLTQTIQLGTLKGGTGSGKSMRIRLAMEAFAPASSLPSYVEVKCKFEAGSYRLYSTDQKKDLVTWTTTATDRYTRIISYLDLQKPGLVYIDIQTPEFPSASETGCIFSVDYTANGTWSSANYIKIYPIEVALLDNDEIVQEAQYKVLNGVTPTKNSAVIDYGTPLLTDISQSFTSKNTFEVNSTGSTWVFSNVWNAGYTTNVELVKTLCLETMSFQTTANPILQATLFVPVDYVSGVAYVPMFHQVYYYESKNWIFNGGTLDCKTDSFNGEWFQFNQSKGGLAVEAQDGDGFIYKGNDKVGTAKKNYYDKDQYTWEYVMSTKYAAIDADTSSGAITSISVTATTKAIKSGDQIAIMHPVNLRTVATLITDGDHASGVTSITIESITPDELLYEGYFVVQRPDQIFESDKIRSLGDAIADMVVTTSTTVPSGGGFGLAGAIVNPQDGSIYYSDGSTTYKIIGSIHT